MDFLFLDVQFHTLAKLSDLGLLSVVGNWNANKIILIW
jgi:hypothetical protein